MILAINGVVAGGGWHFYWQADIPIAADHATFLEPHASVGWVPLREMLGLATKAPFSVVMRMALMGTPSDCRPSGPMTWGSSPSSSHTSV